MNAPKQLVTKYQYLSQHASMKSSDDDVYIQFEPRISLTVSLRPLAKHLVQAYFNNH